MKINRLTVIAHEIAEGVFAVNAKSLKGEWFQHNGPVAADYFTKAQADALVARVVIAGEIDRAHWTCGNGGYYGTDDHEMALLEAEQIEG